MPRDYFGPSNPGWKGGISRDNMRYKRASLARYPRIGSVRRFEAAAIERYLRGGFVREEVSRALRVVGGR